MPVNIDAAVSPKKLLYLGSVYSIRPTTSPSIILEPRSEDIVPTPVPTAITPSTTGPRTSPTLCIPADINVGKNKATLPMPVNIDDAVSPKKSLYTGALYSINPAISPSNKLEPRPVDISPTPIPIFLTTSITPPITSPIL